MKTTQKQIKEALTGGKAIETAKGKFRVSGFGKEVCLIETETGKEIHFDGYTQRSQTRREAVRQAWEWVNEI